MTSNANRLVRAGRLVPIRAYGALMGHIASDSGPRDHLVSFVESDEELLDSLVPFVVDGWRRQEPVVVVATESHRRALESELSARGFQTDRLRSAGRLVTLDASETLTTFMVDGRPDPALFQKQIADALDRVRPGRVSIFGEMVRLLWESGNVTGAIELEECWNALGAERSFILLCGYSHSVLDPTSLADVGRVCALHSDVLPPPGFADAVAAHAPPSTSRQQEHARTFLPVAHSVPAVRNFVKETLSRWGEKALVENAVLLSSEIATNAVRHAVSPFHVTLVRSGASVTLAVTDAGAGVAARRVPDDDDPSGRGFVIVDALARDWGVDDLPSGKTVWAVLG